MYRERVRHFQAIQRLWTSWMKRTIRAAMRSSRIRSAEAHGRGVAARVRCVAEHRRQLGGEGRPEEVERG